MMINQANQNSNNSEREALKELNGIAKGLLVDLAWKWGEVYDQNIRKKEQQQAESNAKKVEQKRDTQVNE